MGGQLLIHGHLSSDATFVLKKLAPSKSKLSRRRQTLRSVRNALKGLCGSDFSVQDYSLHTYAIDIQDAPMEYVVVDERRIARPPDVASLPDVYDPSLVARALSDAGFKGGFVKYPLDEKPPPVDETGQVPPPRLDDALSPWPAYERTLRGGFLYPPKLRVTKPFPFTLTLPGHAIPPLYNLIAGACEVLPSILREFVSLLFVWTRSLALHGFTPTCLALMAIRFMQDTFGHDEINFFKDLPATDSAAWIFLEYQDPSTRRPSWITSPVELDVNFSIPRELQQDTPMGLLLFHFFKLWCDAVSISRKSILSIREKDLPRRKAAARKKVSSEPQDDNLISHPPDTWKHQCLVVQDPFVPTHNHAEGVSNETLRYFGIHCLLASRSIYKGHHLLSIFGEQSPFHWQSKDAAILADAIPSNMTKIRYAPHDSSSRSELESFFEDSEDAFARARRDATMRRMQAIVRQAYGWQYVLEAFGSTQYGVSSSSSDLDLVVVDLQRLNGFSPSVNLKKLPRIYNVRSLASTFRANGFVNVRSVPWATVPIVKCTDPETGTDCDVNVNDQLGFRNTRMIKQYCDLSPILRPMIRFIKHWAKPLGLNSPSQHGQPVTFSSYALALMTIGLLQTRGLLPNLQEGLPQLQYDTPQDLFWLRAKTGPIQCDTRFRTDSLLPPRSVSLEEALVDWFHYWGYSHPYASHMMSIRDGGLVPQSSQAVEEPESEFPTNDEDVEEENRGGGSATARRHDLVLADPFIPNKNLAARISNQGIERFRLDCQRAAVILHLGGSFSDVLGVEPSPSRR